MHTYVNIASKNRRRGRKEMRWNSFGGISTARVSVLACWGSLLILAVGGQQTSNGEDGSLHLVSASAEAPGKDLRLSYVSAVDGTEQPYRVYVPTGYDGTRPIPVILALHGTAGDESTLIDDKKYQRGAIKQAAEKHGVLLVSPRGRGTAEYRGIGENDVLCVLEEVCKRYKVDRDRVYLTGHSMGGTGSAYLALHHPDQFAAVAPLGSAYSFPWLARNAAKIPFLWIGGALDYDFYHRGVGQGVERMRKFGVPVLEEVLPNADHYEPAQDFDRVFAWLLRHRRDPHPRAYFFETDTPLHGHAWWTCVDKIARPGRMASLEAEAPSGQRVRFTPTNLAEFSFTPDPKVFDLSEPIEVVVAGKTVFQGRIGSDAELRLRGGPGSWQATLDKRRDVSPTAYRTHPVAEAPEVLDMLGTEKRLANWITDAMRQATGADIALYNPIYYRGLPIPKGTVDIVDLIQCSRPFDQYLVTVRFTGRDLLEILDANLPGEKNQPRMSIDEPGAGRLVQISGARYVFDLRRPAGQRIVESDLEPDRVYTVALEGQVVERETMLLAGRFKKLDYSCTDIPFTLALYGHAARTGRIEARREGRVREAGK
jgi:predicted esterase